MSLWRYAFPTFPTGVFVGWSLSGLAIGLVISMIFWGRDADGWWSHFRLALLGAVVGGILGLGWYALFGTCRLAVV